MGKVVCVSGMIGCGKSTFIENYTKHLVNNHMISVKPIYEFVEGNELLPLMYEDPIRWTYTSQVRFLSHKLDSIYEALNTPCSIAIVERSYLEHRIFADTQYRLGRMSKLEYDSYIELYNTCSRLIPNIIDIHIKVPFDTCMKRMFNRARDFELGETYKYYETLYDTYLEYYSSHLDNLTIEDSVGYQIYKRLDNLILEGVLNYG